MHKWGLLAGIVACLALMSSTAFAQATSWVGFGGDLRNSRSAGTDARLSPATIHTLQTKWRFVPQGDISATPAVENDDLYVPDWAGRLYKLDARTGTLRWSVAIGTPAYPNAVARTTPVLDGDRLIVGDQPNRLDATHLPARVIAFSKSTGERLWSTAVDENEAAMITQSPIVHAGRVYVGVSSNEEVLTLQPLHACCSFRGSMLALDARTGRILWKTPTVPVGFSGGSIWGSTAAIDERRGLLYVATGNNYTVPPTVAACQRTTRDPSSCLPADDHIDSLLAFELATGRIRWARRVTRGDTWIVPCAIENPGMGPCPDPAGVDEDFGSGPNLFTIRPNGAVRDVVGAGQKNGMYTALDADTGAVVWQTGVGPGGLSGGIQWGSAVDATRLYVADANSYHEHYRLASGEITHGGAWSALDPATGRILWQTADPNHALDVGPMTVASGVVFAGSLDARGTMYALDAATGTILWHFASGGSVASGPAIANGTVYWGSGYAHQNVIGPRMATGNRALYAFAIRG